MYKRDLNRVNRISQEIQRNISVIIQQKIRDPRIGIPTISGVQVSKDLKNVKVFITFLDKNDINEIHSAILVLQKASSFIRFLLASSMSFRIVPVLLFRYDYSLIRGLELCRVVSKLNIK